MRGNIYSTNCLTSNYTFFLCISSHVNQFTGSLLSAPSLDIVIPNFFPRCTPSTEELPNPNPALLDMAQMHLGFNIVFFFFPFLFLHFFFTPFHNCILMYCHQPQMMWQQIRVARAAFTGNVHFGLSGKRRTALKTVYVAKRLFNFIISWVFN